MSLSASMWTSVSGLIAHGDKMNTVGNNIANVSTVGFKAQRTDFQDFVYQTVTTASGLGQVGRGVSIGALMNDYSQGSLEITTNSMDMAITGNGFFQVRASGNENMYYTRAGNFRFNSDGYLTDPNGNILQGWKVPADKQQSFGTNNPSGIVGTGVPTDVLLETFSCPPRHTSATYLSLNLPSSKVASTTDKSTNAEHPFFSLLNNWDATQTPALGDGSYAAQTTMKVFDEAGKSHTLTIYYDRVSNKNPSEIEGYTDGESYWEYIVTMTPEEDVRDFSSTYNPNLATPTTADVPDSLKGLLGAGTLTFSSNGTLKDMSCFVPHTDGSNSDTWWKTNAAGGVEPDLTKWVAAPLNTDGLPVVAPNFSGTAGLSQAYQNGIWDQPNANADGLLISLDFGLSSKSHQWNFAADPAGNTPSTYVDTAGRSTTLVTAAGIEKTSLVQKQDSMGRYEWESTSVDPLTGLPYKIYTSTATNPGPLSPTVATGNNATQHYYDITAGTPPTTTRITTANDYGMGGPTVTYTANTNPDDSLSRSYSFGALPFHTLTISRTATTDAYIVPSGITGTWTMTTSGGIDTWTNTSMAGNTMTLQTPAGTYTTPAQVANAVTTNVSTMLTTDATTYYWTGTVSGETGVSIPVTTTNPMPPFPTTSTQQGNNATEYYYQDPGNPSVQIVATSTPPNNPASHTAPGTLTVSASMKAVTTGNKYLTAGLANQGVLRDSSVTSYGTAYYENNVNQDGYTYGDLKDVYVGANGVVTGQYTNGKSLALYQVALYDFPSEQNLRREGGNLFSETLESGAAARGAAGVARFGTVQGSALEQSNVDLSREFVNMISTQRGFQANSKSITTVDTMLETVIGMKR